MRGLCLPANENLLATPCSSSGPEAVTSDHGCRGVLERSEPVPFRLTRNLQTFFTPFGVEGVFITAMAVAAQVTLLSLALYLMLLFATIAVLVTCCYKVKYRPRSR